MQVILRPAEDDGLGWKLSSGQKILGDFVEKEGGLDSYLIAKREAGMAI